ncbi:hypothetical protein [Agriterribacter humi]|jgi:hypothetical protein|uniref:hypothetical protein n=1 Tax=Agriterribacter humi TaxID=1104781 RepID=UPI00126485F8|nr:hypothetical protein [Agriterribacter humi]
MAENNGEIVWFSRQLPFRKKNESLPISQRKTNALEDCERLLQEDPDGRDWAISRHEWKNPGKSSDKYKLTVWISSTIKGPGGPGDPPIPVKKKPPSSM